MGKKTAYIGWLARRRDVKEAIVELRGQRVGQGRWLAVGEQYWAGEEVDRREERRCVFRGRFQSVDKSGESMAVAVAG
jgi:hypothetical protein